MNIGEIQREIIIEPLPMTVPVQEPAPEPEKVPA